MYIARVTLRIASKGSDATPYNLTSGDEVKGMDTATLRHALEKGWIEKVSEAVTAAPEQKLKEPLIQSSVEVKKESFTAKVKRLAGLKFSKP